jgi:manganese/zinc/iron transport system permease protein
MNGLVDELIVFDIPVVLAALLALCACGTLGNWLVLRKESMTGDAIAHAVLPGLVGGFLVVGRHSVPAMFAGASVAGVCAILCANWVRRRARLEPAAALGIVFTAFFALGVTLLETFGARQVDLDPDCVLFGSLERMFLVPPAEGPLILGAPRELWTLLAAAAVSVGATVLLLKELRVHAFDPGFAQVSGAAPRWIGTAMLCVTTVAIIASFEAVGSILVIALLACPALIAAPHCRSLRGRFALSLGAGALLTVAGYTLAAHAPSILGTRTALSAAGMIAMLLALGVPASHLVARLLRRGVSRRPA